MTGRIGGLLLIAPMAAQPAYFALQGESDQVEFRNIELAELP